MRRPLLVSLMLLGLVVTGIGGMGVFAPFTDRATTGVNEVTSGERPRAADLKLAWSVDSIFDCDIETYTDNSTTPGHDAVDVQPGFRDIQSFCLRNDGSSTLNVQLAVIDRADVDIACTGDESAAGDATCGANATGELSNVLAAYVVLVDCTAGNGPVPTFMGMLAADPSTSLGTLAPGQTICGSIESAYPQNRTDEDELIAQSDRVTWKYAFDGST
jgi:predicted ribosomally synthesized peptide with SipW-like signal peptide